MTLAVWLCRNCSRAILAKPGIEQRGCILCKAGGVDLVGTVEVAE